MAPPEEVAAFPDTNVFLHYRPVPELDWHSMAHGHPVRIQIAPIVTRELEERKTFHSIKHIRERAAVALKMLHKFLEEGVPCKIRDGVLLDFLIHEPSQEFALSRHLNLQLADDWLVATVLAFRETNPAAKTLLVTSDLPLIVKARHYQIDVVQPPSNQRLQDVPDAAEQKIRSLENELRQYKSRVPDLTVLFDDGEDHKKFQIFPPLPNVESEIESSLRAIKEKHPLTKPEPQPQQTGLPISDVLSQQLAETVRSITAAAHGFQEDYDARLKRWYGRYEDYLRETAALKDRERRTINLNLMLVNRGSCPAEDIHMMFHFPDGFEIYDEESQPDLPEEPTPPSPGYAFPVLSIPASLIRPQIPRLPQPENPHAPKIRKTNSYDVTFHCNRLKHDFLYRCRPLYLAFDSFDAAQSFSFTYSIHAANTPLPQNGALHVILEKQT
jgi:PIN domain